jgi:diguanylate cyclase (GGDEF)-like protein/PAS domain S-box-containing protein
MQTHNKDCFNYDHFYDQLPYICMLINVDGLIQYINNKGEKLLHYNLDELKNKHLDELHHERDIHSCMDMIAKSINLPDVHHHTERKIRKKDNNSIWAKEIYKSIGAFNNKDLIQVVCEDITQNKLNYDELLYQSKHDSLTNLVNRSEFEIRLKRILDKVKKNNSEHTLGYIDLDRFKLVNDICGHSAGDELLSQIAILFKNVVRERDTVARIGGDEFGILLEHCSELQAKKITATIQKSLENFRFYWQGKTFSPGASIGLVPINNTCTDYTELLKKADDACYTAKDLGGSRVYYLNGDNDEILIKRTQAIWVNKINNAIKEDKLCLYLQPIVSTDGDEPGFYEALVRIIDNNKIIPPDIFLPAAERYGIIHKIDKWVVNTAIDQISKDQGINKHINRLSINLSGASLANDELLDFITRKLHQSNVETKRICFEITETAAILNLPKALHFIKTLRDQGCSFALDDFGTGLSSYAYLKSIPVDYIKIDGSFIRDIANNDFDFTVVNSIKQIGHEMNKKIIAEHVEDDETLTILKKMGIDYVQGFNVGKPNNISNYI